MSKLLVLASQNIEVEGVPDEVKILPLGKVHSQKGDFIVDKAGFDVMYQQFKDRNLDLVIDYEHQTLQDVQAPAGGWIKDMYLGTDAIVAKVEWNKRAKEYLENKEYRYLSPVILVRKKDNRAVILQSVALTNTPAVDGMFPIVNSIDIEDIEEPELNEEENTMELKELLEMLGLPESATPEEIKAKIAEMNKNAKADPTKMPGEEEKKTDEPAKKEEKDTAMEQVANSVILGSLGLTDEAKTEEVVTAIMSLKAGSVSLGADMVKRDAQNAVQLALSAGKITAAQKEWAVQYALTDKKGFEKFVSMTPTVVPMGSVDNTDDKTKSKDKDDAFEKEVLKSCGVSKSDVDKYYDLSES